MYDDNRYYSAQEYQRVWKHSSEIAQEVEENMLVMGIVTVMAAMTTIAMMVISR